MELATLAGTVSTVLFATANLPMVVKAVRSRDLASYSLPALWMGNIGNLFHTFYVVTLPFGPVWVLHGFYLVTMLAMLAMYLRYRVGSRHDRRQRHDRRGAPGPSRRELA
ncbi:hypothetical protein ARHIZOSPH14_17620 [Agromyces rhizosphaerae]|uniref:PQ-loop repeat-containing protein n=1 Tax=Agromyces rhizosphaerae TaxID=88374 RepID=A0A9W6CWB4_9MICO|nr:hypothetical protein [Agromyces rhizosphaerae]GLI27520.1 hypothetical protein ARHIZOSPH14_17620 [Agromyces rhizosphaerae]